MLHKKDGEKRLTSGHTMAFPKTVFQLCITLLPVLILMGLSSAYGQEEELILNNPGAYPKKQRAAVTFPHELHMGEYDCLTCHHKYQDGENILDEDELEEGNPAIRCATCHNSAARTGLRDAFHRQCIGCHRKLRIAGETTGPELCGECHINSRKIPKP